MPYIEIKHNIYLNINAELTLMLQFKSAISQND